MRARCIAGDPGQFAVFADGELVAQRQTGVLARLLGGGWPDPQQVVDALGKRMARSH